MIEDVKDLSKLEKEKKRNRELMSRCFGTCLPPLIVGAAGMTLFALFLTSDFMAAFTVENAISTVSRFVMALFLMGFMFVGVYGIRGKDGKPARSYYLAAIMVVVTFIASVTGAVLTNTFAMLLSLCVLVLVQLVDRRTAVLSLATTVGMLVINFVLSEGSEYFTMLEVIASIVCNALAALVISYFAGRHLSRIKYLLMALFAPLIVQPFVVLITLAEGKFTIDILWNVIGCYGANIVSAIAFMPIVAIFESMFNIADDFRLSELCNLSNPLLKRLASEAPGTFNHSLVVGNLAEACASAIGENPNMARCAAYYHDIGKLKAPIYFSENQSSYNPHDELIPEVSVSMITSHTLFGEILARQNRLPSEIVDICRQHHGTSPVGYFYRKALSLKEDGDLAVSTYTYSGPKPQTKIAAIIMIADTIEAAMRAYMPDTRAEYEQRIYKLVDEKIEMNQFDECPITMGDIAIIKQTIIEVLPSIHHSRVDYDKRR